MGLDLTHCKATLERQVVSNSYLIQGKTKEDFKEFNVPFEHFKPYIQQIDCANVIDSVIVVNKKSELNEVKEWFKNSDIDILLNDDHDEFKKILKSYEFNKGIEGCNKHVNDSVVGCKWAVYTYYKIETNEGFYFKVVGEQRKGMNDAFWERFYSEVIYNFALQEDFEHAYSCLAHYNENKIRIIEQNFKKIFLDNFELGASFMSLSY